MTDTITVAAYPGAKNRTAHKYIPFIPYKDIDTYIEPYAGSFGVGLNKARHSVEIYNDKDKALVNLFRLLSDRDKGMEVLRMLYTFDYSEEFFAYALKYLEAETFETESLYAGALTWATLLFSYNGLRKQFKGIYKGSEVVEMHKKLTKKVYAIQRLQGVTILNEDGDALIEKHKSDAKTFIFADPPYTEEHITGKNKRRKIYKHEKIKDFDQYAFLDKLSDAKAKIFVCSYENEIYNKVLCDTYGWNRVHVTDTYKYLSAGIMGKRKERVAEVGYINYDIRECR